VSGIIRAEMNLNPLTWFQDIEYMMSSTWRAVCNKINGTYLMPGFTAFRKKTLILIGGFERDTLCEDFDIGVRIKKAGYMMTMSNATMYTHVPQNIPALVRQRLRWSRGTLQVVKKHSDVPFNLRYGAMGLYGIPTQMYWFLHGFISLPLTAYQLGFGYLTYFVQYHDYFSLNVASYFFNWFSVYGMVDYSIKSFTGVYPMTLVFIFCFASFALGTLFTFLAIFRHSTLDVRHLLAVFFFFPYSFFALTVFMTPLLYELNPLTWGKAGRNIWTK
jgi:cellulose synthase/poly-beta-1,6-N-acetylglucosamine synthase-like glycosyltransferase